MTREFFTDWVMGSKKGGSWVGEIVNGNPTVGTGL